MSNSLLIAIYDDKFNFTELMHALLEVPGVSELRQPLDRSLTCLWEASFELNDRWTYLTVLNESALSIHGYNDETLTFAILFAKAFASYSSQPLMVFDEAFTMCQKLTSELDLATLCQRIRENSHAGDPSIAVSPETPPTV